MEEERKLRQQLEEKLRQSDKDMEEAMYLTDDLEEKLAKKEQELSEKEKALKKLSDQGKLKEAVGGELEELKANNQTLQQSLAEKERLIDNFNKLQRDLETKLSAKTDLITELEHQLSLAEQESQKAEPAGIAELKEQLVEKEKEALKEISAKIGALDEELKAKDELLSELQEEVRSYVTEIEEVIFVSLDLSPLADKGVLLKVEPDGPIVALKRIRCDGASFEPDRKLAVPSPCNITLIFFGSFSPLTVSGSLTWQKKIPGSSRYNVRFAFLSLKQNETDRINEYVNETQELLVLQREFA